MENNISILRGFAAQLPRNLLSNIIYFMANIVIGVLLVPYFISTLGIAAYGLIPLATSMTGYVAIVVQSLNTAISRFLTVDIQREDYAAANRTFNTAFFCLSAIMLLMIPILIAIAGFVPSFFDIPANQQSNSVILFFGIFASFLIRLWTGNFTVQLFAYNRLDLLNLVNIVNLLVQTGLILSFFYFFDTDLAFIGYSYLIGTLVASCVSIALARRICPYLRLSISSFDQTKVRELLEMSWWIVISQIGVLLFLSIDLIIVNLLFGATLAGNYSIALQWGILLRAIGVLLSSVLTPMILSCFARKENESLIRLTKSAVKLMGLGMALPVGLICGFAPDILTVWIGSEFSNLASLMILLIVFLPVNLAVMPLFSINIAFNRVRLPGILTLAMGIGNIALAIAMSIKLGYGYYGVAAAGAIILTAKNAFFTPWYATKVLGIDVHTFTGSILTGFAATIFVSILATIFDSLFRASNLVILVIGSVFVSALYIAMVWLFGISDFERKIFKFYIPSNYRKQLSNE